MARTPYATRTYDTSQKGPRVPNVTPSYIVIHHAASESFEGVIQLELGNKQVSSTVVVKDDQVASMFDETYRAWSLSSQYWDSVSLSMEVCNSGGAAQGWPISEVSYATIAKVVADWCRRYNIPCNRDRVIGHGEVYTRFGASYATACPGGINLDRVVSDANAILGGGSSTNGDKVALIITIDKASPDGLVKAGESYGLAHGDAPWRKLGKYDLYLWSLAGAAKVTTSGENMQVYLREHVVPVVAGGVDLSPIMNGISAVAAAITALDAQDDQYEAKRAAAAAELKALVQAVPAAVVKAEGAALTNG